VRWRDLEKAQKQHENVKIDHFGISKKVSKLNELDSINIKNEVEIAYIFTFYIKVTRTPQSIESTRDRLAARTS